MGVIYATNGCASLYIKSKSTYAIAMDEEILHVNDTLPMYDIVLEH